MADPDNDVFASAVSAFEAATKYRIGKWNDIGPFATSFEATLTSLGYPVVDISAAHAVLAGLMPGKHRDPFDRLLAAQAEIEGMVLVSNDPAFAAFSVQAVW
nr:type II toxin-antitoxin system VapC family toxin [Hoeflea marina]